MTHHPRSSERPPRLFFLFGKVAVWYALVCLFATAALADGGSGDVTEAGCPGCIGDVSLPLVERVGGRARGPVPGEIATYPFFPQAGYLWGDLFISNYTDRVAGTGIGDFDGGTATYNGHGGIDCNLLTWEQQDAGFPIYAAYDGLVIDAHDGEFDMNTTWEGQPANYVVIFHEAGNLTRYWHLKKNSVAVSPGDQVYAGQQIGLTGSSGISTAPHLHFETVYGFDVYEPFAGAQRSGLSLWQNQPPNATHTYIREFVISPTTFNDWDGLPNPLPHGGTFVASDSSQPIYSWWYMINRPAGTTYTLTVTRPDGTVAASTTGSYANASRRGWTWRTRWAVMDVVGTWHVNLVVNDEPLVQAPFTVVANALEIANRPPFDAGFRFRKSPITVDDVPVCEVDGFEVIDDPDYDLVSYRYLWKVNGAVVRDVTTGAKSDALARNLFGLDDVIRCEITPTDGSASAATATVEATVTETFSDWAERVGQSTDPTANPDGDAFPNLLEYVHGTSPTTADPLVEVDTSGTLVSWDPAWAERWANVEIEFSPDLDAESWQPASVDLDSGHWTEPGGGAERGFFRITASPMAEPDYSIPASELGPPTP